MASRANEDRIGSVGDLERTILALDAAGLDPRSFAGRDLVAELVAARDANGSYSEQVNLTAFALVALRSVGSSDGGRTARWLRSAANQDGGWGFRRGAESDADSTGAALQALALGGGGAAVGDGASYLRRTQRSDGSWSLAGGASNSQSTAWAVQGLVATGGSSSAVNGGLRYIGALQSSDGHYRYSSSSDQTPVWVTGQALLAATRSPFPLATVPRAPARERDSGGDGSNGGSGGVGAPAGSPGTGGPVHGSGGAAFGGAGPARAARGGDGAGKAREPGAEADDRRRAAATQGEPGLVEAETAAATEAESNGSAALPVALGLGGLALALAAGWLWYRRTLP